MRSKIQLIIIGAGDHAKVLLDILLEQNYEVLGLIDKNVPKDSLVYGIPVLGDDAVVLNYDKNKVSLVNGIGSVGNLNLRKKIYDFFKEKGYNFFSVIHPSSFVSKRVLLKEGVQVLPGVVINTDASIGENTIVNSNSTVEHGCIIGDNVHIAPGCTLSGCVSVGNCTHIGTGTSVIQGINIGSNVLVGAGSLVIKSIGNNSKVYGVPARDYEKK